MTNKIEINKETIIDNWNEILKKILELEIHGKCNCASYHKQKTHKHWTKKAGHFIPQFRTLTEIKISSLAIIEFTISRNVYIDLAPHSQSKVITQGLREIHLWKNLEGMFKENVKEFCGSIPEGLVPEGWGAYPLHFLHPKDMGQEISPTIPWKQGSLWNIPETSLCTHLLLCLSTVGELTFSLSCNCLFI